MTEDQTPALEAGDEVVLAESVIEGAEAPENTEGQVEGQPKTADDEEKKSKSAIRREKRRENEHRLREQAEEATKKAEEAEARLAKIKSYAESEQEPKEDDFSDSFEYAAAKALWKHAQKAARREESEIRTEAERYKDQVRRLETERLTERQQAYIEQAAEAKTRYADFDAVVSVVGRSEYLAPQVAEMVLESDVAADVAYHLGKNPAVARELSRMSPLSAARELGRIEANLSRAQARTQTQAPEPITPVKGTGTAQRDPSKMGHAEFKAWRESGGTF